MAFKMRTGKPEAGNKYYITKANGGILTQSREAPQTRTVMFFPTVSGMLMDDSMKLADMGTVSTSVL